MIELALAALVTVLPARECAVQLEASDEKPRALLRVRPQCPIGFATTQDAVQRLLAYAAGEPEVSVFLGRAVDYPWLSILIARNASAAIDWDLKKDRPFGIGLNAWTSRSLARMTEFTALFAPWTVRSVSVEKVLLKQAQSLDLPQGAPVPPRAKLPYDAQIWVRLSRR